MAICSQNMAREGTPGCGAPKLLVWEQLSSLRGMQPGSVLFEQKARENCVLVKTPQISTSQLKCKNAATQENRSSNLRRMKQHHYPLRREPLASSAIAVV